MTTRRWRPIIPLHAEHGHDFSRYDDLRQR